MKEQEAIDKALATVERNDDGSIDEKALIDEVAALIDFDEEAERRNKAVRALKKRRTPGSTEADGSMELPGLEPYGYEPRRLIADNDGHVIEQADATPHYKAAEAERARQTAKRQTAWADRKSAESARFSGWFIDQLRSGRSEADLVFGIFVRETGVWRDTPEPVEADPTDDTAGGTR